MLNYILDAKKVKVKDLEVLTGYLNFLNRAIFLGRAFTRRMYAKFTNLSQNLKKHHHLRIDKEFKEDCKVWLNFLDHNMIDAVCHPYVDLTINKKARVLNFYTDASASKLKGGFGCFFEKRWIKGKWDTEFLQVIEPSIEFLEHAALCIVVFAWGTYFRNERVIIFCDNEPVVSMVNNSTSSCKRCMRLIRLLTLKSLELNTRVFVRHVRTEDNEIAVSLSRDQM